MRNNKIIKKNEVNLDDLLHACKHYIKNSEEFTEEEVEFFDQLLIVFLFKVSYILTMNLRVNLNKEITKNFLEFLEELMYYIVYTSPEDVLESWLDSFAEESFFDLVPFKEILMRKQFSQSIELSSVEALDYLIYNRLLKANKDKHFFFELLKDNNAFNNNDDKNYSTDELELLIDGTYSESFCESEFYLFQRWLYLEKIIFADKLKDNLEAFQISSKRNMKGFLINFLVHKLIRYVPIKQLKVENVKMFQHSIAVTNTLFFIRQNLLNDRKRVKSILKPRRNRAKAKVLRFV